MSSSCPYCGNWCDAEQWERIAQAEQARCLAFGKKVQEACAELAEKEVFDGVTAMLPSDIRHLDLRALLDEPTTKETT